MKKNFIRIGGASGYWGDATSATAQLLATENLDYIVYDYLAEITMSIMARARSKNPAFGYAPDFVSAAMAPNLKKIAKQGVKIITNAGGVNPLACAKALEAKISELGLSLRVACITGDDLLSAAHSLNQSNIRGMFGDDDFPDPAKIASINIYSGAFCIARVLDLGADIVITGRCVDSAVTLAPCIHEFGWKNTDYDLLASGSLAGHIIECGAQATGGNFTDWELSANDMDNIGYPIVEIDSDGELLVSKPDDTGGLVSVATVGEQIVYEIGDPQNYQLPDVSCDFSDVVLTQQGKDKVKVSGARGHAGPLKLKTAITWHDGFRGGHVLTFYGFDADKKARTYTELVFKRCERLLEENGLAPFSKTSIEVLGNESQFGAQAEIEGSREVCVKIAACHEQDKGIQILLREITAMALSGPPGISGFAGTRPRPSPVIALFSCLLERGNLVQVIHFEGDDVEYVAEQSDDKEAMKLSRITLPETPAISNETIEVPLIKLASGRSGDKGDKANIGIIARHDKYLPYIWQQLDEARIARWFAHFVEGDVKRYLLPGLGAINFVLDQALDGGGTASLRNDPQGKGYAQILLAIKIEIPVEMSEGLL